MLQIDEIEGLNNTFGTSFGELDSLREDILS